MIDEEAPEIQLYLAYIISQYLETQPCHKEQDKVAEHSAYARAKLTKSQIYQTHLFSLPFCWARLSWHLPTRDSDYAKETIYKKKNNPLLEKKIKRKKIQVLWLPSKMFHPADKSLWYLMSL